MDWIKVTPETMPNERQYVLVTYIDCTGEKCVDPDCLFEDGKFKRYDFRWEEYEETDDIVTHWMPLPEPAED